MSTAFTLPDNAFIVRIPMRRLVVLNVLLTAVAVVSEMVAFRVIHSTRPDLSIPTLGYALLLIALHEASHALGWIIRGIPARKIKFGIHWRVLAPYAHCAIPVPMSSYRLTLVLPLFTTGCLPVILGLSQADPDLAFIGAFMIGGAAADLAMLEASICFHGNVQVQDHPSAPAFIILNKSNIESPDVQIQDTALS